MTRPATAADALPLSLTPTGPGTTRTLLPGRFERASAWVSDNEHLIINGNEPGKTSRAFVLSLDGGEPRPVTPEGIIVIPDSARDGYLLGRAADGTLTRYPIDGGAPQLLNARIPAGRTALRASDRRRGARLSLRALPPRPLPRRRPALEGPSAKLAQ